MIVQGRPCKIWSWLSMDDLTSEWWFKVSVLTWLLNASVGMNKSYMLFGLSPKASQARWWLISSKSCEDCWLIDLGSNEICQSIIWIGYYCLYGKRILDCAWAEKGQMQTLILSKTSQRLLMSVGMVGWMTKYLGELFDAGIKIRTLSKIIEWSWSSCQARAIRVNGGPMS